MILLEKKVVEILKNNCELSLLYEYFNDDDILFDFGYSDEKGNIYQVDVVIKRLDWETVLPLQIDTVGYNENLSDVEKYEVEDMGLDIRIYNGNDDEGECLNEKNIWKYLFFNKEPISQK